MRISDWSSDVCSSDLAVPFALQQGVGRHRGAHLDRLDSARRQRLALLQAEEAADALHGSILVLLGVLRQQLMGDQRAVGLARHDVSEGAAAVDPELPAGLPLVVVHDSVRHFRKRARFPCGRSEEHTSELQSLMRISYAVFCLNKKN